MELTKVERSILSDLIELKEWEIEDNILISDDLDEIKELKKELKKLNKLSEKILNLMKGGNK